jgi:hypothetical protein
VKNVLDFKISSFSHGNGAHKIKIERYDDTYEFWFPGFDEKSLTELLKCLEKIHEKCIDKK